MTLTQQLHTSKAHRTGFDPNCPQCLKEQGLQGVINHLKECSAQNEKDFDSGESDFSAMAVANEQNRMIGILRLLQKHGVK